MVSESQNPLCSALKMERKKEETSVSSHLGILLFMAFQIDSGGIWASQHNVAWNYKTVD